MVQLDWSNIEPSIFGELFVRGLDPGQRAKLGAQYTDRADIELIVEAVLMASNSHFGIRRLKSQQQLHEVGLRRLETQPT